MSEKLKRHNVGHEFLTAEGDPEFDGWGGLMVYLQDDVDPAISALTARVAELEAELGYIANAKRFDREKFTDGIEFADWAQSRARAALRSSAATSGGEK